MTTRSRAARVVGGLECAAEDVVIRDGDRPEAFRLGVVDQLGGVDAAVVRPRGVHVQVGDDPRPVCERLGLPPLAPARADRRVDRLELARHLLERVRLGLGAGVCALALPQRRVLGEPRGRRRGELRLGLDAARPRDRAAGGRCLEGHPAQPTHSRHEDRGRVEQGRAARGVPLRSRVHARGEVAGDRRAPDQRTRAQQHDLPAGKLAQRVHDPARDDPLVGAQLDDDRLPLRFRREQCSVDSRGENAVVAREALLRGIAHVVGERDQRVEPREQLLALRAGRRIAEPVRRRRTWRRRAHRCRAARGRRARAGPGSKPWTTS